MGATPKIPTVTAELPPWRFPTFLSFLVLRSALCVASSPLTPATDRPHSDLRSLLSPPFPPLDFVFCVSFLVSYVFFFSFCVGRSDIRRHHSERARFFPRASASCLCFSANITPLYFHSSCGRVEECAWSFLGLKDPDVV